MLTVEEGTDCLIVAGFDESRRLVIVEMILQLSRRCIKFYTKSMEEFAVGDRGIDICHHNDVATLIEV